MSLRKRNEKKFGLLKGQASVLVLLFAVFGLSVSGTLKEASAQDQNALFQYPHLLSSPYTLPAGGVVLGSYVAVGLTDFLQVGTDVLRDFYKFYNASMKFSLINGAGFALSLTGGYETYNYKDFDSANPDLQVTSWQPGLISAIALFPELAAFLGGNLNFTEAKLNQAGLKTYGFSRGAQVEFDLAWAYGGLTRRGNVLQALSLGVTYDFTYELYGLGLSHTWRGFKLGFHYYPQADENRLLPIIVGGATLAL